MARSFPEMLVERAETACGEVAVSYRCVTC